MAWRTIASSETDPGAPMTSELAKAYADNPAAVANGDAGAPRIKDAALDTGVATTAGVEWVRKRTIGQIIFARVFGGTFPYIFGDEIDGGDLRYAASDGGFSGGPTAGTTWQCLGYAYSDGTGAPSDTTLWQRVA